jgi:hypothetical protein
MQKLRTGHTHIDRAGEIKLREQPLGIGAIARTQRVSPGVAFIGSAVGVPYAISAKQSPSEVLAADENILTRFRHLLLFPHLLFPSRARTGANGLIGLSVLFSWNCGEID